MIARNPPIRFLSPIVLTYQVDANKWIDELENIINRKIMWSASFPMGPQMQIMRQIRLPAQLGDSSLVRQNIEHVVNDLNSMVEFLRE